MRFARLLVILLVALTSFYLFLPNLGLIGGKKLNFGLDLRGGASLTLQIDTDPYINEKIASTLEELSAFIDPNNIQSEKVGGVYQLKLPYKLANKDLLGYLAKSHDIDHKRDRDLLYIHYSSDRLKEVKSRLAEDSVSSVRKRIDEFGVKESSIYILGTDKIVIELPGIQDPEELKLLIGKTAKLSFHLVASDTDIRKLSLKDVYGNTYPVQKNPVLTGEALVNADARFGQGSSPSIYFKFSTEGGKKFAKITKQNIGRQLAIVLDQTILTSPMIKEPIFNGQGEITGRFSSKEAKELAVLLRSGALPAKLTVVEEQIIGPTLGAESISSAKVSGLISAVVVCCFMIVAYAWYGLIATVALFLNMLIILAVLTAIQATLTLPGIAGLILTVGMAVDSNVLIFESIKEEFVKNKNIRFATFKGFEQAKSAILDSNLTTLIAAFVMLFLGSGPVKGFAITLSVGIFSSMFAALFATRWAVEFFFVKRCNNKSI